VDPRVLQPSREDRRRQSFETVGQRDGWFAIGIFRNKHLSNHGSLWRSAWQLGAAFLYTVEDRLGAQPRPVEGNADTSQAWLRLPSFRFRAFEALREASPEGAALVAVEMGGEPLETFVHPERAIYLLGAEDQGLPPSVVTSCTHHVTLPTVREASLNVAACGAVVMYDRELKSRLWGGCGPSLERVVDGCEAGGTPGSASAPPRSQPRRAKQAASAPTGGEGGWEGHGHSADAAHWAKTRRQALEKAALHIAVREDTHPELDALRTVLDSSERFFVSKAAPPEVVVEAPGVPAARVSAGSVAGPPNCSEGDPRVQIERRLVVALTHASQKVDAVGGQPQAAALQEASFRPLLLHVRCRDIAAAHWLIKECTGLADASATSIDLSKVLVRISGRGRPSELLLPAGGGGAPVEAAAAAAVGSLAERLARAQEELQLLNERLSRSLASRRAPRPAKAAGVTDEGIHTRTRAGAEAPAA